jgi:hypothetical protein
LDDVIDDLLALDLVALSSQELLELTCRVEVAKRRLPAVDHRLVADLCDRGVAAEVCIPNTAALLRALLRISPGEASRRVRAAADLGPRRGLTGAALPPLFEDVAAAQATGMISAEHAAIITHAIDKLPHAVEADHGAAVQAELVHHAATLDPRQLATVARRIHDYLDPDGIAPRDADHHRQRALTLSRSRDGSYYLNGTLTPECGTTWATILDSVSRPVPSVDGLPDTRRPGQRLHDGLHDAGQRLLRTGELPDTAGIPTTLILIANVEDATNGTGYATTTRGDLIPIKKAIDLAGDGQLLSVLFDAHGGIHDYGQTRRLVPPAMRMALIARDRGCTFPGCDRPAAWCEAHHLIAFADGGPTSLTNTGLLCGYHHREHPRQGWQGIMIDGVPHWIPPAWLNPTRTPLRNTMHDQPTIRT